MLIGIDGNEANFSKRVGIGEYAFELLTNFAKLRKEDLNFEIYLKNPPIEELPVPAFNWRYKIVGPRKMWTQFGLPLNLYTGRRKPDVFFSPTHYSPRFSPVPTVMSVMDLSYLFFPELFNKEDLYQLTNWTEYSVKKASHVITISQSSKSDIIKEYGVPADKITVTYPGLRKNVSNPGRMKKISEKYGINGRYILFVGTLQPRKNIVKLVEAFSLISNKYSDVTLVIAGRKGWLYEEILASPSRYGIEDRTKFIDYVESEDLPSLYKNAEFFILPSLYEGFGLPVLEAMKNDCPVITSNVSSLPEAGGDAALYVDPGDPKDMAEKMEKVLTDDKLRNEMIAKGRDHVRRFSWEKTARQTLKVLEGVVKSS